MKRILFIFLTLALWVQASYSQMDKDLQASYRIVFWIRLELRYMRDPKLNVPVYRIRLKDKKIYVGNLKEFQEAIWAGMSNGNYIVIGPFSSRKEVTLAKKIYGLKTEDPQIESDLTSYHWYLVRLGRYSRLKSYKFLHIPAAVTDGTLREFLGVLNAARYNDAIVIGPFQTRMEAELSKRMFRQEESK